MEEAPGLPGVDPPGPRTAPIDATVAAVPATTTLTRWERFRDLPAAGQVAIWCTAGFVVLLLAAGLITLLRDDSPDKVSTAPIDTDVSTTTSFETTTTTMVPTTVITVPGPPVIPASDPSTTLAPTTVPPESSTTAEPTTVVETTVAPATVPPTAPPTTAAPATTAAPTTTTPPTTTTTTTTMPPTTTTTPFDPDNSACNDATGDGTEGIDLLDSTIHRPADHQTYVFTAHASGTKAGSVVRYTWRLGADALALVAEVDGDTMVAALINTDTEQQTPIDPADVDVSITQAVVTVQSNDLGELNTTAFDWVVQLRVDQQNIDDCTVVGFGTTNG